MRVPFDSPRWDWGSARRADTRHAGRACVGLTADEGDSVVTLPDLELEHGSVEVQLCVGAERSFHGVVWRLAGDDDYESFFVRPHQVGNPDAIQYTPVWNGISAWQLYHGTGYGNAIDFPLGEWFAIRVAFAGDRADIEVAGKPVLQCRLKGPPAAGGIGVLVGGAGLLLAELAYDTSTPALAELPPEPDEPGAVPAWLVSDPVSEAGLPELELDDALADRTWTTLVAEPSGLVNLARAHPLADGRNTVFARAVVRSEHDVTRRVDIGFSDRAVVYLNGRALYRGADAYRSRDYRFLGTIGWYDTLYLPLRAGENELAIAVSEDFGGWGVQARFEDTTDLTFEPS